MRITVRGSITAAALLAGAVAVTMSLSGCSSISDLTNQIPGLGGSQPTVVAPVAAKAAVPAPAPTLAPVVEPTPTSVIAEAKSVAGNVTTVPDTHNQTVENAIKALQDAHLTYHIVWSTKTTVDSRSVVSQSPKANQTVDIGTPVTIAVQTGRRSGTINNHRKAYGEYAPWETIPYNDTWDREERGNGFDGGSALSSAPRTPRLPDWWWREDVN
jgi:PASTA domain